MKTFRVVRIDGSTEIIKFFELSKHCSVKEFSSSLQHFFGNSSTIGCSQVLCDSSGKKTDFEDLQNGKTYFITFEKKEKNSFLT